MDLSPKARDALVKRISAALAEGKDSGGYETLLDMYAHIALKVVEDQITEDLSYAQA